MNDARKRSPHDFVFKQELGHGSYSTVYKAVDRTNANRVYAIKVCSKQHIIKEKKVKYVTIEKNTLNLLTRARHPGIVKLHYTFHDEENLYFVLDYAPGGELLSLLHRMKTFSDVWACHFTCQLIDSMQFLHSQGIIHRDLKPENLLLNNEGRLMITDFGTATGTDSRGSSFVGTAEYVSPELLLHNQCDVSSDIWALGCMIYQFLQGSPPFRGENELQTFEKTVSLDYPWSNPQVAPKGINPVAVDLTRRILVLDPSARPTLQQIKLHKWFELIDWNNKELLWRGIWQIQQAVPRSPHQMIANRKLHVIDTPIRNIPITKQKKRKPTKVSNTTSSIVEWRKKLGISGVDPLTPSDSPTQGYTTLNNRPSSPAFIQPTVRSAPVPHHPPIHKSPVRKSSSSSLPRLMVDTQKGSNGIPSINSSPIDMPINTVSKAIVEHDNFALKQDCVIIYEIPYYLQGPEMSLKSYNRVDNDLITQLVQEHDVELRSRPVSFLSLFKDGTLSYRTESSSRHIINIGDPNLSMYDFDFNQEKGTGFLILERYRNKIWFISIPSKKQTPVGSIKNKDESWVACFFRARQLMEDQKSLSDKVAGIKLTEPMKTTRPISSKAQRNASSPVLGSKSQQQRKASASRSPATSPVLVQSPTMKRYAAPQNMVISSSRYEVLHSLRPNSANDDASSGASAAFKNLQKRKAK